MPIVHREQGYRFYFYSHEPPPVHVDKGGTSLKVWLDPVELARNAGVRPREVGAVLERVRQDRTMLPEAWHDTFGTNR